MIEMEWMYDEDIKIRSNNKQWRKLVDYFNQMREEKFWEKWYFEYKNRFDKVHIISKNMWFIKWLIDNNKINFEVLRKWNIHYWSIDEPDYEALIMVLAVEDNPITVLLSILK